MLGALDALVQHPVRGQARTYLLVSGPPGSGKTTLAPVLAHHFDLPLLAKDTIKDALVRQLPPADVEASRELGCAAVAVMLAVAADAPRGAVIESVFHRSRALTEIAALPGRVVEVFCRCEHEVASERYRRRAGTRHGGHFDLERSPEELWNPDVAEPVAGGWPVVVVDTNDAVDFAVLCVRIEHAIAEIARP